MNPSAWKPRAICILRPSNHQTRICPFRSIIFSTPLGSRYQFSSSANVFASRCICRPLGVSLYSQQMGRSRTGSDYDPFSALRREVEEASTYRMVLPVRRRIHCGIGRFCFCALASFCFVRKDLWDCINLVSDGLEIPWQGHHLQAS